MNRDRTAAVRHPGWIFTVTTGVLVAMTLFGFLSRAAHAEELAVGDAAPGFELMDQNNETQQLADYRGEWVVLYFYPKDDTPGCTTEACNFRDDIHQLQDMGARVLGVSLDSMESHKEFAEKYHLPYPLLADRKGAVARKYGALFDFGPVEFAKRHTFIIDPEGNIARIYRDVKPKTHSDEVIEALKGLKPDAGR
jgi:peroxiredoxin Q/BCP